jgi:S1-C subfamily serine protease
MDPVTGEKRSSAAPWIAVSVVLAIALAFAGGYAVRTATTKEPPPTPSPTPADAGVDVARILLPSTVFVKAGDGIGSGFVYDAKQGYILTAAHVVQAAKDVTVRLSDGTPLKGKVLGRDTQRDTAVIGVTHKGLVAAKLAHAGDLRVGELTVAVGSPFGLQDTITIGVLSGIGRTLETPGGAVDAIQTDAAINPGNSGGPLADRYGRVIGINVAMRGAPGAGVGLAVPIDVALQAATYLERGKAPPRVAFLGITGGEPDEAAAGALIMDVKPNSPALRAGLERGDRIVAIDGTAIKTFPELGEAIRKHVPGDTVTVRYVRDGKTKDVKITLGDFS